MDERETAVRPSSFNIVVPLPEGGEALLFHGYSGAVDLVRANVAELLGSRDNGFSAALKTLSSETVRQLRQRGYLTDKSPGEEQEYVLKLGKCVHRAARKHASPGTLLIPTYSCNLRCSYCYERSLRDKGSEWLETTMTPETAEAALQAVTRLGQDRRPSRALTLYGGEPFQSRNSRLVRLLYERAREHGFRRFSAITNAVELDALADLLGPGPKFSFLQITLDGPPEIHDRRRFRPDRQGSFRQIADNIHLALEKGVQVSVRVNVDRHNAEDLGALSDYFQSRGWPRNPRFRAYCSPVHGGACGRKNRFHFDSHLDMQNAVQASLEQEGCREAHPAFEVASFTHAVRKRIARHLAQKNGLPLWKTAFCGSNVSMVLFDPFGDIYPCWEVIGHPEHRIGRYGPGFLDLDPGSVERWHARSVVEIPACRSCAYLFFCGGGCEAFAYQATGRFDESHCFDFPRHFQTAALLAYRDWASRGPET